MLSARSCLLVALPALVALGSPVQGAPALRSAFVPVAVPSSPLTVVQGSLQNKPGANGVCGGPLVGTAKQRAAQEKVLAEKRKLAKVEKAQRDAEKAKARQED
jgi:hypothetical protein